MKRAIVIVAIIAILAGAGGAGWWFFLREAPDEDAMAAAEPSAPDVNFTQVLDLEPIILPILREGQVMQHITLVLNVRFAKPEERVEVKKMAPRLRDVMLRELHGIFAFRHLQERGETLPVVRQRLIAAANTVFGDGVVEAVLVKAVSRRTPDII